MQLSPVVLIDPCTLESDLGRTLAVLSRPVGARVIYFPQDCRARSTWTETTKRIYFSARRGGSCRPARGRRAEGRASRWSLSLRSRRALAASGAGNEGGGVRIFRALSDRPAQPFFDPQPDDGLVAKPVLTCHLLRQLQEVLIDPQGDRLPPLPRMPVAIGLQRVLGTFQGRAAPRLVPLVESPEVRSPLRSQRRGKSRESGHRPPSVEGR
jgi:hypothetical protein